MTNTYYKQVDPELKNSKYGMTCNQNNRSAINRLRCDWRNCSTVPQSEAASSQHQGGHYLDQEGTAGIHLLAITIRDRNQGDIL